MVSVVTAFSRRRVGRKVGLPMWIAGNQELPAEFIIEAVVAA
jgi:hypothetical protein